MTSILTLLGSRNHQMMRFKTPERYSTMQFGKPVPGRSIVIGEHVGIFSVTRIWTGQEWVFTAVCARSTRIYLRVPTPV